jgi:Tol biopolymer transport system component/DNA-binding winged helix-turn-helix (wHTH) protein
MSQTARHLYEFGPFRLDATERLLLRGEQHIPLTPKAFETLLVLVEHGGHVIEKNELMKKVWPNTFVEEVNLAKNVSSLRKILGGETSEQLYIETIPKRGYRFIAGVREVWAEQATSEPHLSEAEVINDREDETADNGPPQASHAGVMSVVEPTRRSLLKSIAAPLVFVVFGASVAVGLWALLSRSKPRPTAPLYTIGPVTSLAGTEDQAAFSPDGKQIAFVWDGANEDNRDIYVKLLGAEQPLRLTTNPAADTDPTWSPDGHDIAFLRQTAKSAELFIISPLGGAERKLADIFPYRPVVIGNTLSYAPDGKFLVAPDKESQDEPFGIFAISVESGEKTKLTSPPGGSLGDLFPAYSPASKTLAFVRSLSIAAADIYLLSPGASEPQRLTIDNTSIRGLSWTSDGKEIVFASRRGGSNYSLWKISTVDKALERLTANERDVYSPTISLQGNRLSYTQSLSDANVWQFDLGKTKGLAQRPAEQFHKLIASSLEENGPQYSSDGKHIVFASRRSGSFEIWICDADGTNARQLTNISGALTGTPRWSPDDRQVVFDSWLGGKAAIYVVNADGGGPRRLTFDADEDVTPSWSRDGRWIYFGCTRSGSMQIWKIPAEGGAPVQVTKRGGFEGFESADGQYFYYAKGRAMPGIWRVPVTGGEETLVIDHHQAGLWRYWAVTGEGIYFATAETASHPLVEFFNFETKKITTIAKLNKPLFKTDPGLAVSPDEKSLLLVQMDQNGSDIMLMENFR